MILNEQQKLDFISKETEKLNKLIESALVKHQKREEMESNDRQYLNSSPAFPESIRLFAVDYLNGIATIISKI